MRQRWSTRKRIAVELAILLVVGYAAFIGWAQDQARRLLHQIAGDVLTVGRVRIGFPLRLILSDVRLTHTPPEALAVAKRVIIVPRWCSWRTHTLRLATIELEEPHLSFRRTKDGALYHPLGVTTAAATGRAADPATEPGHPPSGGWAKEVPEHVVFRPPRALRPPAWSQGWQVVIETIQVTGGTVGLVDEHPSEAFHGALAQLLIDGGPLTLPPKATPASITMQGRVVGEQARSAPAYCSGWVDVEGKNLELSCRLDSCPLAAFGPYYQGPLRQHVFDATVQATGQFTSKANAFEGRVSLQIDHLSEADVSVFGRTLADLKKVPEGEGRALSGEIKMAGPLDVPSAWRIQLVPGNEIVQRLVNPLLMYGIEIIRIRVGTQTIPVGLTAATQDVMSNIQAASQQVQDSLQVIAPAPPAVFLSPAPASPPSEPAPAPEAAPAPSLPDAPPAEPAPPSEAPPEAPPSSTPSAPPAPSTSTR